MRKLSWMLALCLLACAPEEPKSQKNQVQARQTSVPKASSPVPWRLPAGPPAGPRAELIRYGRTLIRETPAQLGPEVKDPALRYGGNLLSCANCHLDAGQRPHAMGYVGIRARFPQFRPRENREQSLAERINGCFMRSLNGRPLPLASRQMQALLAYMDWLSQGYAKGAKVQGQGLPELPLPTRAADPDKGQQVFTARCAACHQADGQGLRQGAGYLYPPLWGPDSFNTGAGMHRLIMSARYIKANMPLDAANLSPAEAFDVAAFINSKPRPVMPGLDKDFPDRAKKPVDAPFEPWNDGFSLTQHKLGPYGPIMAARGQTKAGGN